MRKCSIRRLLVLVLLVLGSGTGECCAQQNLFNVPSGRITPYDTVFFQQQFNLRGDGISNTTINFGGPDNFEYGMNILDVPAYNDPHSNLSVSNGFPDILFNVQKGFWLTEDTHLAIGGQFGGAAAAESVVFSEFSVFDWVVAEKEVEGIGFFYGGAYFGNRTYLGPGNNFGAMLGYEIPLVEDRFVLMGDVLTGTNDISVAVLGGAYTIPDSHWQISLGYQVPFPRSGNGNGAVLEFTWLPVKPEHDPRIDSGPATPSAARRRSRTALATTKFSLALP